MAKIADWFDDFVDDLEFKLMHDRDFTAAAFVVMVMLILGGGVGGFFWMASAQQKREAKKAKQCLVDHTDTQYKFVDRPDTLMFIGHNGCDCHVRFVGRDGITVRHSVNGFVDNKDAIKNAVRGDEILVHTSETMGGELRRRVRRNITQDQAIQKFTQQR